MLKIGWIGLGYMGTPMAKNVLKAGNTLYVYNRTKEKAQGLANEGAILCETPQELTEKSDVIITMLTDGAAVKDVLEQEEGILAGLDHSKIVIDMSTVSPEDSVLFSELVRTKEAAFIDAPVSGSVKPAEDGTLVILPGGNAEDIQKVQPIFDILGKKTVHFGENGKGASAKLVINLLLGITMQGASEALLLAEKLGLEKESTLEMILASAVGTPLVTGKKQLFEKEEFPAAFMLKLMSKDLGLALKEADKNGTSLPLTKAADQTYGSAKEHGKGELDLSAVFLELKEQNS
ncbi:NAD(P)-dependent oxidoreductase [Bacillus gobiensis]|uniref:NAD(P)-dependent oxidoreductase n=1 Tax=Bacillus gobiensis TaxID=1441095 RepID=UPI003D25B83A